MEIIFLIIGLSAGFFIGFLFMKVKYPAQPTEENSAKEFQVKVESLENELNNERNQLKEKISHLATSQAQLEAARERLQLQKEDLIEAKKMLNLEFEKLANRIFEERSQKFKKENKEGLDHILAPLKEKIKDFEEKVEKTHRTDTQERAGLKVELERLMQLNQQLSTEAKELTSALKGESKTQGNWGEFILERVLESSGLEKGREYEVQASTKDSQGNRVQPDVVINLPDNKHIIVDSKVSLSAYERFVNNQDKTQAESDLRDHMTSIKNHIKQLSEKDYQNAEGIISPDFVLLFIPIEASFAIAVQADHELFNYAWQKKVVVVTPSTLLATLRTIASVWKLEKQNRNVLEISRLAGKLYDKFVAFSTDLEKVGTRLELADKAYQEARNKLMTGKDNIVRIAERTKELGAQPKKSLPAEWIDQASENQALSPGED